jgi:hypothetical protein
VGVQEVRWDKRDTVRAGDYIFYKKKETKIINWEEDFVLNVHASSEKNSDD